ncbi:uncharacterized protein V6R79_017689 [Siganus canaliculatus]
MPPEETFCFLTEWFNPESRIVKRFVLTYYPRDGSVKMWDVKNKKLFLRKIKYPDLCLEDLFIGNRVTVFSRQLHLIDYADQYTANKLALKKQRTFGLIKPDDVTKIGDVFNSLYSSNLRVTKAKMTKLTWSQAEDFYVEHQSKPFFSNLVQLLSSGPVVAMELVGDEAISIWRKLLGPADSAVVCSEAQCGPDGIKNFGHASASPDAAAREVEFFFPSTAGHGPSNTATFTDSTCCIIKPHAVSEGLAGKILNSISAAGFEISALQMFNMGRANAQEFFEAYKGVVPEYPDMVTELCSGPCLVLEIRGTDVAKSFRDFCGPADPELARHLRPTTLRALYGKDTVKNAVHCTDTPEDCVLEVQYFFEILGGRM